MATAFSSILQCPSCSAVLYFSTEKTNIISCGTCNKVIQKKEGDILMIKPFAKVEASFEIIQPGTSGKWKDEKFKVLGRFRTWLEEVVFNYWTIQFNNGDIAYLAEGYGIYAILNRTNVDKKPSSKALQNAKADSKIDLFSDNPFLLEKKQHCRKWEVEGELYLPDTEIEFNIYEYSSASKHISLFEFLKDYIVAYDVFYCSFSELELTGLRSYKNPGRTFACPQCHKSIVVKAYPYSQSCSCIYCGTHYTLEKPGEIKRTGKRNETDAASDIELGSSGKLKGTEYEVVGYVQKEENNSYKSRWKEYTLFSQTEGFAFLSEYDGHWIYVRETPGGPVLFKKKPNSFGYKGNIFELFNSYTFTIVNALGEFPYNTFDSTDTHVNEFICPPEIWIIETSKAEGITKFKGEHIGESEIKSAFLFPNGLPPRTGVGAVEPKGSTSIRKIILATLVAILFLTGVHIITGYTKQNRVILEKTFFFNDTSNQLTYVTNKFRLEKWSSNLEFYIHASVSNSWFEMNATLVNSRTGKEYSLEKGVEYYYGYSEGSNWSEGSTSEKTYLTNIPEGDYVLQINGIKDPNASTRLSEFALQVTYDVSNDRNMWLGIVGLLIWGVIHYKLVHYNEKRRWSNSPFSPFDE